MPREKSTTQESTRTVEKKTQRVTSLEPREGQRLTSLEEAVVRMHHGVSVKPEAKLPTNGVSAELMQKLLEMEVRAFEETGRIDELDDIPAGARGSTNESTQRIVSELKKKI